MNCKSCGQAVAETSQGLVHVGGGRTVQVCQNGACGWKGGQMGEFQSCPACGRADTLIIEHTASV